MHDMLTVVGFCSQRRRQDLSSRTVGCNVHLGSTWPMTHVRKETCLMFVFCVLPAVFYFLLSAVVSADTQRERVCCNASA
jgi:hypothetical protein